MKCVFHIFIHSDNYVHFFQAEDDLFLSNITNTYVEIISPISSKKFKAYECLIGRRKSARTPQVAFLDTAPHAFSCSGIRFFQISLQNMRATVLLPFSERPYFFLSSAFFASLHRYSLAATMDAIRWYLSVVLL